MSRGKYPFKESDITRALKAARKAGEVVQIEVDADRRCMRIIPVKAASGGDNVSEDDLRKLLPPRSALTLPRYVLRKPLKRGWGYFFNVPIWARKAGCPVKNEALGINYEVAVTRAETVLLPAFDDWRSGGASADAPTLMVAAPGTLDWVFAEYRADWRFTKLPAKTRRDYEAGLNLVGNSAQE